MKVKIEDVKIKKRIREEMGDISLLQQSISTYGLFNPILINQNYELLAGARRLYACKNLEWQEIEVKIIATNSDLFKLEVESHENLMRKDFTEHEIEKIIERKRQLLKKGFFISIFRFVKKIFIAIGEFLARLSKKHSLTHLNHEN